MQQAPPPPTTLTLRLRQPQPQPQFPPTLTSVTDEYSAEQQYEIKLKPTKIKPIILGTPMQFRIPTITANDPNNTSTNITNTPPTSSPKLSLFKRLKKSTSSYLPTRSNRVKATPAQNENYEYWIVRDVSTKSRKAKATKCKDVQCAVLGRLDETSLLTFKNSRGGNELIVGETEPNLQTTAITTPPPSTMNTIKYNSQITLYTNFGDGGRYLSSVHDSMEESKYTQYAKDKNNRVFWKDEDGLFGRCENTTNLKPTKWCLRPSSSSSSSNDDLSNNSSTVNYGDHFYLESVTMPNYFIKWRWSSKTQSQSQSQTQDDEQLPPQQSSVKGGYVNVLEEGRDNALLQVLEPNLQFALKLGNRRILYKAASKSNTNNTTQTNNSKIASINMYLPTEILTHILTYFCGCEPSPSLLFPELSPKKPQFHFHDPYNLALVPVLNSMQYQKDLDLRPFTIKTESVRYLKTSRLVCKYWEGIINGLFIGLKYGGGFVDNHSYSKRHSNRTTDGGSENNSGYGNQKSKMEFFAKFGKLKIINLRGMDAVTDRDIRTILNAPPLIRNLRVLNLGGCLHVTDATVKDIKKHVNIVHLNLAYTNISENAVLALVKQLKYIVTLNLFGVKRLTYNGLCEIVGNMEYLSSLNVRAAGAGGNGVFGYRDKIGIEGCCRLGEGCVVLVGEEKWEGVY